MIYSEIKTQVIQLVLQRNPFEDNDPRRNYRQIYNDLIDFRKVENELSSYGMLLPVPLNGKSWEEEKNEYWDIQLNKLNDLLNSGKIESCEIKSLLEACIIGTHRDKDKEGLWNHIGVQTHHSSTFDFGGQEYTIDEMIEVTEKIIQGNATLQEYLDVNKVLDSMGTSACDPRAYLNFQEKSSEVYDSNLILSQPHKPRYI
ncbi:MAG: hypothetical protein MRY83_25030 [Flavobacteriales bacterium]|nr:hypothetical protein [Flavobacteriales bacterium]